MIELLSLCLCVCVSLSDMRDQFNLFITRSQPLHFPVACFWIFFHAPIKGKIFVPALLVSLCVRDGERERLDHEEVLLGSDGNQWNEILLCVLFFFFFLSAEINEILFDSIFTLLIPQNPTLSRQQVPLLSKAKRKRF